MTNIEDTLENDWSNVTLVPALRSKIVLDLSTLQDKHNLRALSVKINLFYSLRNLLD